MFDFENITSFKEACTALGLNYNDAIFIVNFTNKISKASAAMFKLNIIRKALNLGQCLHFAKNPENSYIYHPYNPLITEDSDYYKSELFSGQIEVIGKVRIEGTLYKVLGGDYLIGTTGLGCFSSLYGVCGADTGIGFLSCATR